MAKDITKGAPLRILRLESENVKRLRVVAITPKGDVVQITGANDNGKTSVLDSIFLALKQVMVDAPVPLRDGAEKGRIRLDLGSPDGEVEFTVERILGKGAGLSVKTVDGAKMPAPQKVLDALIGSLSFDPLAFTRMKPKDQAAELRRCVNLEVDVEHLAALNAADFDKRTEINRHARERRAEADGISIPEAKDPVVDVRELLDQIEQAAGHNENVGRLAQRIRDMEDKASLMRKTALGQRAEADALIARAAELDESALKNEKSAEELQRAVSESKLPERLDVSNLRLELERAQLANKVHDERKAALERRQAGITAAERFEAQAKDLTECMAAREEQRAKAIQSAKMPVEGLSFGQVNGETVVTYRGVPFQQASSAVQLRVSLGIAMASKPRVRVIRIQDGSLLDEKSMQAVADMAREHDFQVWVEVVRNDDKVGVYIEDGTVAAIDGKRLA